MELEPARIDDRAAHVAGVGPDGRATDDGDASRVVVDGSCPAPVSGEHRAAHQQAAALLVLTIPANTSAQVEPLAANDDLVVASATVAYLVDLELLVFEQSVAGITGGTAPEARGQLDGAPVLGYVFPTTLAPEDVGFGGADGIVALAAMSHPDFDDTPLWDEDGDLAYDDDGAIFHSHWVLLGPDDRVPGGSAVIEHVAAAGAVVLPPTNPRA